MIPIFKPATKTNLKCTLCGNRLALLEIKPQIGTYRTAKGEEKDKDPVLVCRCQFCGSAFSTPLNDKKTIVDVQGRCIIKMAQ